MAVNQKCQCCGYDLDEVKVQMLTLEDGRHAERRAFTDENGDEVVEIFAEEKRPLKLEKRIVKKRKEVVAEETCQTIKDGMVISEETMANEVDVPLKVVEKLDFVHRDEIGKLVADGVVAGMQALMETWGPENAAGKVETVELVQHRVSAQNIVEKNVAEKKASDHTTLIVLGIILVAQVAFCLYMFLM